MHFNLEMVGLVLAFTIPAIAEPVIYTSGITGSAHPRITPAPQVNDALAPQVAGPLTISVTNSFGSGLYASFGHNAGSPTAISYPGNGAIGASFEAVYPANWAGRIAIGKDDDPDYINRGSLIEASYDNGAPFVDISYVQGFSIPIVCSCGDPGTGVVTGCNIPLYHDDGPPCPSQGPSAICFNPSSNSPQATPGPAPPFFAPCAGAAFTYPNDFGAGAGCGTNLISCCIGSTCPADPKQP
ncbi:hypothetical protein HO173_002337 [Letharia columbiana]|uniref:Thaumatin-like protein n=1 Tax=Letharia columbiana TaxID=112416 RepID=A0A8H6G3K5_9LECA|nr:uncharacterized protein HO173_002337 [Letharia columbiana]KAF6239791.1 hypothetical protein HO173_002337 [Letharia columbiana]